MMAPMERGFSLSRPDATRCWYQGPNDGPDGEGIFTQVIDHRILSSQASE